MKKITKGWLSTLRPRADRYDVYDGNLLAIVRPSGRVTFYVYTTAGGSRKKYKLGSFPDNKLDEYQLNNVATEYRRIWSNLHLPTGMRPLDLERQSHRAFVEAGKRWEAEQAHTLEHVFKEYMRLHGDKKKSGHQDVMVMNSKFSHLFDHPIKTLDRNAIVKALHSIDGDVAANMARSIIRGVINWSVDNGFSNDRDIVKRLPKRAEFERVRTLNDNEMRKLWPSLPAIHKFLLATGQRRMDAVNMNWVDIDNRTRVWKQPDSKTGNEHSIMLPEWTMGLMPEQGDSPAVFNSQRGRRYSLQRVSKLFLEIVRDVGIDNVTVHDLRRTALTNMGSLGDISVAERVANHAPPGQQRRYFVGTMVEEKGMLLKLWSDRLEGLVN